MNGNQTGAVRYLTRDDSHRVLVRDLGGAGKTVLLAHGTSFHGAVWASLARELTPAFHCVALDFSGHGDSDGLPDQFDWDEFRLDIETVADDLDETPVLGVGHSLGGAALLKTAAVNPGLFVGLYCYEPAVHDEGVVRGAEFAEQAIRRRATFSSLEDAYERFAARDPLAALEAGVLRDYVEHGLAPGPRGGVTLKCTPEWEAAVYQTYAGSGVYRVLDTVACPVVIAHGEQSGIFGQVNAEILASRLGNARIDSFPDLDHFGPLTAPAEVGRAVRAWAESLTA